MKLFVNKVIVISAAACTVIGGIVALVTYDDRLAKKKDVAEIETSIKENYVDLVERVNLVNRRLELKIIRDKIDWLRTQILTYEHRYGGPTIPKAPPHELKNYAFLIDMLEVQKQEISIRKLDKVN